MANCPYPLLALALCQALSSQAGHTPRPGSIEVPSHTIQVDGDLRDWKNIPVITTGSGEKIGDLTTASHVWDQARRRKWQGVADLSATIKICYDGAHLYLAGEIHDDHHVGADEGQLPETGDAIEVFLDLRGGADADEGGPTDRLDKRDVQLFLMPRAGRWTRRPWDRDTNAPLPPTGSELTGIQLAHRVIDATANVYTFEARIPFHNFLDLGDGESIEDLGFQLALNDRDPGSRVVHYMTLTGENPTLDTRRFPALRFAGTPPLAPGAPAGLGLGTRFLELLPWALAALLVLATILIFSRRVPLVRLPPVQARLARALGVVLLMCGLLLPGFLDRHETNAVEERLRAAATLLEAELPKMEQGTLKSYVGDTRDEPLLDLLQGRAVHRKQFLSHQFLSEMAPGRFGRAPRLYPEDYFHVRPYWIPLPADQPQSFSFKRPLTGGVLHIVVSQPIRFDPGAMDVPELRLAFRAQGKSEYEAAQELPEPSGAMVSCAEFGRLNREMAYFKAAIPGPVEELSLTTLLGDELELVGMTVVPDQPDTRERPLVLGQAVGGVESDLNGAYPEDAGFELRDRGDNKLVTIPVGRRRTFHKLWFVYSATYPGFLVLPEIKEGDEVCRIRIGLSKGEQEDTVLLHQRSMFYELSSRNRDVPEGVPVEQVDVGEDADGDKRIHVVYALDVPRGATVTSLRFENTGPYPIRFRSVIFGYEQSVAPADLPDSPLVSVAGRKVRLKDEHLETVAQMGFAIYRNGSLVRSSLGEADRERYADIPASVRRERLRDPEKTYPSTVDEGDTRIFGRYLRLRGSGTDVVLGVWAKDVAHGERQRLISMLGVVLCLLSAPFLLLLFNDALAWLSNLRLRLMAVVSVAALVPLAVLFILLVRALERGHEDELQRTMRQAVRTVSDQLRDRQDRLREAATSHMALLRQDEQECLTEPKGDVVELQKKLVDTMTRQKLWEGGFMRLDYTPAENAPAWLHPFVSAVGDARLASAGTPLRGEPGFSLAWGQPIIGVRYQEGSMSLSVARPLDEGFLANISPSLSAVICETKGGYQLAASSVDPELGPVLGHGPELMRARAAVPAEARDSRQPVFKRHRVSGRSWVAAYDVLRDLQDTPRAILGVVDVDQTATLSLAIGRVPVRSFFVVMAGLLLVLSIALASIVTSRITEPIERLEKGAESLRRGQLDVRVESHEGGQIGRLTETFNNMAQDLRGRIQDLNHLNRGIQELTSRLDLDQVIASAIAFFSRHSPADRVRVILIDWERDRAEIFGETPIEVDRNAADVAALLSATGSTSVQLRGGVLAELFPGYRSLLALPLVLAGRARGTILLLFESARPVRVNLELLSTIAAQTTAAIENARLYRHAVEDLYTGAYVPEYFSRLVGHAVAAAQDEGRVLSLIGVRLLQVQHQEEALGAEGFGRYMERVVRSIRRDAGGDAKVCRWATDTFHVLLPRADRREATEATAAIEGCLVEEFQIRGVADLRVASVTFPEEGASAEFLFHALSSKLIAGPGAEVVPGGVGAGAGIVLSSPAMAEVVRVLQKVAPADLTILLTGETGTGKEVLANLIHKWSNRAKGPLVKVHCAALSESLLQSELFGHEKGAFTGATGRKLGKFEQADGGTVFLDEIGEISLETQVKLLRVLQEREVDRVGGLQPVPVDVRVVAATNGDIEAMVRDGSFREDLYYRLQGMVVTVPPLRDRKSEIPDLLEAFRTEAVAEGHTAVRGFSTDAMDEIFRRDWPGNIRELRNAAFRAMVLAGDGMVERTHILGLLPTVPSVAVPRQPSRQSTGSGSSPALPGAVAPAEDVVVPRPPASKGLSGRLEHLHRLIRARGTLSNQEYVTEAGLSPRTGLRDLGELLEMGLIVREGRRRGARYRVATHAVAPPSRGE